MKKQRGVDAADPVNDDDPSGPNAAPGVSLTVEVIPQQAPRQQQQQ